MNLPAYDELPIRPDLPPGSSWAVWGDDDELGAINLLTPERVRRAVAGVRRGVVFSLNWQLEGPTPPLFGRGALTHEIRLPRPGLFDDVLHNFFPQSSTQFDALCHVGHPLHGFYNGRDAADITGKPGTKLGIDNFAKRGIVGRGVLLDIARHWESTGRFIDGGCQYEFTPEDLEEVREAQGLSFKVGDILILRTGWMAWYLAASDDIRGDLADDSVTRLKTPGLASGAEMAAYLWNQHFAAVCADNPALESWPHPLEPGGYLHLDLIPLLGIPIGEMWLVEELAADCAADGVYEFLLTSAPLNIRGGIGSPPNALAIK